MLRLGVGAGTRARAGIALSEVRINWRDLAMTNRLLEGMAVRAARRHGIKVAFTPAVARLVVDRGFSPEFGARELRHVIQREIEPPLAQLLMDNTVTADHLVRVRIRNGELCFEIEE